MGDCFRPYLLRALPAVARRFLGGRKRVMGIEPTSKAWEAFILPLNYTREITGIYTELLILRVWISSGR